MQDCATGTSVERFPLVRRTLSSATLAPDAESVRVPDALVIGTRLMNRS